MKGKIKAYSVSVNAGVIAGNDGQTYLFSRSEWEGTDIPKDDQKVDFDGNVKKAKKVINT